MKRDLDYMRDLSMGFEEDKSDIILDPRTVGGDRRRHHHIDLLCDAGLLREVRPKSSYRVTNDGHDFLANIRDRSVWGKTKETAKQVGSDAIPIVRDFALGLAKQRLKSAFGIK